MKTNKLFKKFHSVCLDYKDKEKRRIFIDRNSKILLVAHGDTVQKPKFHYKHNNKIYASGLDDRIGCWIIYLLSCELKTDLLITDNEEKAGSTAEFHKCKEYNWIAEFDRRGEDIVFYDTGSEEFEKALKEYFKVGWGSFTDISVMKTESACVNIGTGVQSEHSIDSWADLNQTKEQIRKFKLFFEKYKNTAFIKDHKGLSTGRYFGYYNGYNINYVGKSCRNYKYRDYINYNDEDFGKCDMCDNNDYIEKYIYTDKVKDGVKTIYFLCDFCAQDLEDLIELYIPPEKANNQKDLSTNFFNPKTTITCTTCQEEIFLTREQICDNNINIFCPFCHSLIELSLNI